MTRTETRPSLLVSALRGEKTNRVPVWFMRQAGRYLPEYNEIRKGLSFLELTQNPELSTEVSVQPYRRFQVDGIIMFADILTPISGAGVPLYFEEKRGPILEKVVEKESDLSLLDRFDPERDTGYVKELLHRLRSHIDGLEADNLPGLLGFAGAPFTLASYLIEGGTTKKFEKTKGLMYGNSALFHRLSERLADITIDYLKMQLKNGADAVQIFDSWGGILSSDDYAEFSAPYTKRIIEAVQKEFSEGAKKPVILFVGNASHLLKEMADQNPDAISLDWRVSASEALRLIPSHIALQGNLDPLILYGNPDQTAERTRRVLQGFASRPGYVFNLGHGIHPGTPIPCVESMIRTVREHRP